MNGLYTAREMEDGDHSRDDLWIVQGREGAFIIVRPVRFVASPLVSEFN